MADVVPKKVRSRMMAGIRGKNTQPERTVRRALHALGFRYSLHGKNLPGHPDMVLPAWHTVVLIHGCFWHGHDCRYFKWPTSRAEFWRAKIGGNRARDERVKAALAEAGWRVLEIWECAVRGSSEEEIATLAARAAKWIRRGSRCLVLRGK